MQCGHARLCVCLCVCLSAAACLHYCTDPDVTWGSGRRCSLVVHYWANLQSLHGLRSYGNITRTRNVSEYVLVLALCLVKTVVTGCHILRLKCTEIGFGSAAPQPAVGAYTAPPEWARPPSWNKGELLLRKGMGTGTGRGDMEEKGRGGERTIIAIAYETLAFSGAVISLDRFICKKWRSPWIPLWARQSRFTAICSRQPGNCVFSLKCFMRFHQETRNTVNNITWSELNHPSLSKRSTGCTRHRKGA